MLTAFKNFNVCAPHCFSNSNYIWRLIAVSMKSRLCRSTSGTCLSTTPSSWSRPCSRHSSTFKTPTSSGGSTRSLWQVWSPGLRAIQTSSDSHRIEIRIYSFYLWITGGLEQASFTNSPPLELSHFVWPNFDSIGDFGFIHVIFFLLIFVSFMF